MKKIILFSVLILFLLCPVVLAQEWKEYTRSGHFIVYYDLAPYDLVLKIAKKAEESFSEIIRNLGFNRYKQWKLGDRIRIYIYNDYESYYNEASAIKWAAGSALIKDKIILTFPSAHGFFDSTLPHELGHIIFREFIGKETSIPLWLDEGIAMYQEEAKRWGINKIVRQLLKDGKFIPLEELSGMTLKNTTQQEELNIFYAEAASIVNFLIGESGEFRFMQFCRKLSEGVSFDDALAVIYTRYSNLNNINKAWTEYLSK
ncbi:MAG: hypothetical protein HQL27_01875 [Candidatus Omnitrophica bacterium]|nr:hypothetical protein [Candidatus Omnitrophota bacterium]